MEAQIAKDFIDFLIEAKTKGYASGDSKKEEKDGSKTIIFSKGRYTYHDNYFGGEPYGGREIVSIDNKPFWMMVYYGRVIKGDTQKLYPFLQKALKTIPEWAPFRGDLEFKEGGLKYVNIVRQNFINNFFGEEQIFQGKELIYEMKYQGGLVDQ